MRSGAPLPPAIVLGIDKPAGLAVVRELGRHAVPVTGLARRPDVPARWSRYLTRFRQRPTGMLRDWLPGLIREEGAAALVALPEVDLVALAALPEMIEDCRILTPRSEPLSAVLDKSRTLALATGFGIDVPRVWLPASPDEAMPDLGWPVVLKWPDPPSVEAALARAGLSWIKANYCADQASVRNLLRRYADAIGRMPMVQQRCPGRGLGQMFYMEAGRATLRFQHERLHEWPAEGGVSSLCRAVPLDRHREQMARSEALLAAISWEGPAMVEYRYDEEHGRYWLMEVNGRFWGSQPLASACGAEFAWELYRRQVLGETTPPPLPRSDLSARHLIRETKRIMRLFLSPDRIKDPAYRPTPGSDLARYLAGFADPRTRGFLFSWKDPVPGFIELPRRRPSQPSV